MHRPLRILAFNVCFTCLLRRGSLQRAGEPIATDSITQIVDPGKDCVYTIHLGNATGALASTVQVGTELYHKIICRGSTASQLAAYCLVVYNCSIASPDQVYRLIDENGCTLEPSLIDDVIYLKDTEAGIRAQAIRINGDSSSRMSLSCQSRFLTREATSKQAGGGATCPQRRPKCRHRP